jgi:hypothetical protein
VNRNLNSSLLPKNALLPDTRRLSAEANTTQLLAASSG